MKDTNTTKERKMNEIKEEKRVKLSLKGRPRACTY